MAHLIARDQVTHVARDLVGHVAISSPVADSSLVTGVVICRFFDFIVDRSLRSESMKEPSMHSERRIDIRFDKAFPVVVKSEIFGDVAGVARNISFGGMMVEMIEPLPLGSFVTVHFRVPDSHGDLAARAEVKHHYCFNFRAGHGPSRVQGIGVRFVEFIADTRDRWQQTFTRRRVLH